MNAARTPRPRSGPYIWATWLARLLVGDASCEWAAWFRAHYKEFERMPGDFDAVAWQIRHTAILNEVRDRLEAGGSSVLTENQCHFSLRGNSGAVIGGKPDLVAFGEDNRAIVYDVKTGQRRPSDAAQVMIYMYALPYVSRYRGMSFEGRVVYADGGEIEIAASAVNDSFRADLHALIRRVTAADAPRRRPSAFECKMCDITPNDCPDRMDADTDGEIADGADF